jgi:pSer/pThr/pTyr-binding forkhead associated (FHA) protein
MTDMHKTPMYDDVTPETTSLLPRAELLNQSGPPSRLGILGVEALPPGSALLVVKRGPNAGSWFPLDRPIISAGRHPHTDIFLDDVTVSRKHAEFRSNDDDGFLVVDLGSLNGTYVNREAVDSAVLESGDEIAIGKFRLTFLITRSSDAGAST